MDVQGDSTEPKPSRNSHSFFSQMFGQDREADPVVLDHCYSKPWNGHPDSLRAKPAKMLFMRGIPFHPALDGPCQDVPVDVDTVTGKPLPPYDSVKAQSAMNECERYASMNTSSENKKGGEDWEESLKKLSVSWTGSQNMLFNKLMKIIQAERLSRLAFEGTQNEPVFRRLAADKSAVRTRHLFGSIGWDMKQLQWLHHTLTDNLDRSHLAIYVDILQSLKGKVPHLVDKLLVVTKATDNFQNVLKRPWDPLANLFTQQKLKKLPGSPILILCPGDPPLGGVGHPRRHKFWHSQLSALGKVVTLNLHISQNMSVRDSIETVMITLKNKIAELKKNSPFRPIVLIGWTVGAVVACQVSLIEGVSAIVCLGFPLTGTLGSRGDLDDPLLESRTPTLFVVGQNACTCSVDDVEDFRERMRAESGLVVIGGGDDHLRVNRLKRKLEGVTQAMVDRCILDEIGEFLSNVLTQPLEDSPQFYSSPEKTKKEPKTKRKNKNKQGMVKEVKAPKRQYNKKQTTKAMSSASVERLSPSSPGSSTTDTSSTCSIGDNLTWKQPKRGVGRPSSSEQAPKKKRMKLHNHGIKTFSTSKPDASPVILPKRQSKVPEIFNNYVTSSQHISVNIGTMSSLGALKTSPPGSVMKAAPPTIPSAASTPKLGSFEAPHSFIARMDMSHTNPTSMLSSSPRMILPNRNSKPKNVTFLTLHNSSGTGVPAAAPLPPPPSIISSSLEASGRERTAASTSRQLLVQKKLMDINQIQSLVQKNTSTTKMSQPVQMLTSGNKNQPKIDSLQYFQSSSQGSTKTSLLQSALSMNKNPVQSAPALSPTTLQPVPSTSTSSHSVTTPRKMQVITFLKPPPNTLVSKPLLISSSEKETDKELAKVLDTPQPKVMRTYGDVKLNRHLAALKQQQQQMGGTLVASSEGSFPDALSHLSTGTQDAVFALTQLSAVTQIQGNDI